jgi:hypothetical protein
MISIKQEPRLKKSMSVDQCKIGSESKRKQLNLAESRVKQNQL